MIIYFTKMYFILIVKKLQDPSFASVLQSLISLLKSERSFKNIRLDLVIPILKSSRDFLVLWIKIKCLNENSMWQGCRIILYSSPPSPLCVLCYGQDSAEDPMTGVTLVASSCRAGSFSFKWHHYRPPPIIPHGQTFLLPHHLTLLLWFIFPVMLITC